MLFLRLLMRGMRTTRVAEFIELDLTLNKLFILAGPIVYALALFAGEFDKLIL